MLAVGFAIRDVKDAGEDVTGRNMMKYLRKVD